MCLYLSAQFLPVAKICLIPHQLNNAEGLLRKLDTVRQASSTAPLTRTAPNASTSSERKKICFEVMASFESVYTFFVILVMVVAGLSSVVFFGLAVSHTSAFTHSCCTGDQSTALATKNFSTGILQDLP